MCNGNHLIPDPIRSVTSSLDEPMSINFSSFNVRNKETSKEDDQVRLVRLRGQRQEAGNRQRERRRRGVLLNFEQDQTTAATSGVSVNY